MPASAPGADLREEGASVRERRSAEAAHAGGGSVLSYRLVPADDLGPEELARVRGIYEDGFPDHLRADFRSVVTGRQPGEIALALTGDGGPCGFALLRPLAPGGQAAQPAQPARAAQPAQAGWIYLRYFVIDAARRGHGLGGRLWDLLTARLREDGYTLLVFDVEDPDEPGCGPDDHRDRARRIGFYARHGAAVLPVTGYRTPCGDEGAPEWTPMVLMAASLTGQPAPVRTADQLREVVEAVYRYRWSLPPGHPQVAGTGLAASDWLR
jgi:GNAT superfamily N-acetyltransferase